MQLANNYDFYNFYQNVDYLQGLQDATGYSQLLTKTQTTFVKRSKYDCYEDNSMYLTNCINEFYAKQLKCNLPWATNMDPDLNHCESEDELTSLKLRLKPRPRVIMAIAAIQFQYLKLWL